MHPNITSIIAADRSQELERRAARAASRAGAQNFSPRAPRHTSLAMTIRRYVRHVSFAR